MLQDEEGAIRDNKVRRILQRVCRARDQEWQRWSEGGEGRGGEGKGDSRAR